MPLPGDEYREASPSELDPSQSNQLQHYHHADVAVTSRGPVALSMVKN